MPTAHHSAFQWIRSVPISALNTTVEEYRHIATGAIHYHMVADNPENVFLVALRTVPMDHKGVAHILEHTALCGSQHYPVRDPFFMMTRRSLNTFMNAFTSNDWTAYPFASQNRKDFNNLLDVYLDAVFFSRLDELDFLQEGHRLEFSEPDNKDSTLEFKGVVFNEMKGAMSSVNSVLWQTLCKHLFPSTTYHFNSGGDPEYITDLSYEELTQFYKKHYHPSNAIFMTYGDIPAAEHQRHFEEKALAHFTASDHTISIPDEKRYNAPIKAEEAYALDGAESTEEQTHIVLAWLLGQNTELKDVLSAQLLSYILMENSASPLQSYLESTDLGTAPSPLCGMEDSYHELVFVCGIAGSEVKHAEQFEQEVLALLQKVADEGLPQERLESIVHQLELSQREISGDGYPYGLQLILTALPSITHRGDPVSLLNLEPALEEVRAAIKQADFVKNLINDLLLDNQHRVRLVMKPDTELSHRKQAAENALLSKIRASLSDSEAETIIAKARALAERQKQVDDPDILPKVGLNDVPPSLKIAQGSQSSVHKIPLHSYHQGTNGIVYQQLILPIPPLSEELLVYLPLYTQCLTEVGIGSKPFTDVQNWQSAVVGHISAYSSLRGSVDSEQHVMGYMILSAKALARNQAAMAELLKATLTEARFDETKRISELISQTRLRKENGITNNGHGLAMNTASALMSPLAQWNETWGGMQGIKTIKQLDDSLKNPQQLEKFTRALSDIHQQMLKMPIQILSVSEKEHQQAIEASLQNLWQTSPANNESISFKPVRGQSKKAWLANSQVNFCAKAYPTVASDHADAPALVVLGGFLRNGFLHTAIREKGGAYGSGASQDTNIAAFRFYSYRDPRITGTLNDFDASISWMLDNNHEPAQLEEAILGVISSLDKPASPAGEAKHAFHNQLFGRTPEQRQAFRQKILAVTLDDLKRVTATYLKPEHASIGVISNDTHKEELKNLGLELHTL
jgi:presequence protease